MSRSALSFRTLWLLQQFRLIDGCFDQELKLFTNNRTMNLRIVSTYGSPADKILSHPVFSERHSRTDSDPKRECSHLETSPIMQA